jgi:hypothetical protein
MQLSEHLPEWNPDETYEWTKETVEEWERVSGGAAFYRDELYGMLAEPLPNGMFHVTFHKID